MSTEVTVRVPSDSDLGREPSPREERALVAWIERNRADIAVVLVLGVALGIVHATGMTSFPARFDDEGAYVSQAWAVLERFDLSHYTYWYDHPPLGWLMLGAYMGLTGSLGRAPYGVAAGRETMLVLHLASVALLYALARRLGLRRLYAAVAVLIFGLSPLGIFFHRMVLLDNLAMPFLLAGFVLILSPQRKLGAHVAAAAAFAIAVLTREILVLLLPFAAWIYARNMEPENRRYSIALTTTTFFGLVLLYPLFALLRGELFPGPDRVSLLGSIGWQLTGRQGSGSILDPSSPAGQVLSSWVTLDPWILILGALSAVALLAIPRLRWVGGIVVLLGVMMLRPGYLPVMYIVQALPFLALAIAGLFDETWDRASQRAGERLPRLSTWARRGVVVLGLVMVGGLAWPHYAIGLARSRTFDADRPFVETQEWLATNLEPDDVVFVDGALWIDLVRTGHDPERVIWFYKLDSDPGVELPGGGGWETADYVISSEVVRNSLYDLPQIEAALNASEPVIVFGEGDGRVEIRRIEAP